MADYHPLTGRPYLASYLFANPATAKYLGQFVNARASFLNTLPIDLLGKSFLAPFLGFLNISYMNFTWVMDHFLYIPMLGIIGLAVAAASQVDRQLSRLARSGFVAVIAIGMIVCSTERRRLKITEHTSAASVPAASPTNASLRVIIAAG